MKVNQLNKMESDETEVLTHPSYGQILLSRSSANDQRFYGSELSSDHYIKLTISRSEMLRDLSHTRYHPKQEVIKVRMNAVQFSEMITSMNIGGGVPCTIEHIGWEDQGQLPNIDSGKTFTHKRFKRRMQEFGNRIVDDQKKAKQLIGKKTLSKDDQFELNMIIEHWTREIKDNIPFFAECFQEIMDDVVQDAVSEIEAKIQHKITSLGLEELHKQQNLLK